MAAKVIKKKAKKTPVLTGPRYWVAMGALAAYSATAGDKTALAQSQPEPVRQAQGNPVQALPAKRYDITPGPLTTVLESFETVAGIKVTAENQSLLGIQPPGVSGLYTVEQALQKLLADIGLDYSFQPDGSVLLSLKRSSS